MKLQGLGYNNCTVVYPLEYKIFTYVFNVKLTVFDSTE